MGISFSCPLAAYNDLENGIESVIVKSIDFENDEGKTTERSISFKGRHPEPTIMQSEQRIIEGSVSLRTRESDIMRSTKSTRVKTKEMYSESPRSDNAGEKMTQFCIFDSGSPKHEAAIKLQKVYKSFRTRRKLADCAVLIEQSWWKLLDFAELKRSSISFFDIDKHETAISRWSRARTRAAKVGKGLSKNGKAQKLALQHWLEAIDPRHRYGHNLHFYYVKWLHSQSKEPFFYWLDIGEGKEVNLVEKCSRSKLQQQCIKYLGPMERKSYEVVVEDGKLLYKQTGELLDTGELKGAKWIFVLSTSRTLYVGKKRKGTFQHSSFLAGGATLAAGRIVAENGVLKAVWPHSGHYKPTLENFQDFVSFLKENNVDLTDVKLDSIDDEEESLSKQGSISHMRSHSSEEDLSEKERSEAVQEDVEDLTLKKIDSMKEAAALALEPPNSSSFSRKLSNLEIPNRDDIFVRLKSESQPIQSSTDNLGTESPLDGYETAEESVTSEQNDDVGQEQAMEEFIPEESILQRINSHKESKSYQLGRQLSCKWSTGAGPRIGCLRDYPSGLQSHALEQVNLSPRRTNFSPRMSPSPSLSRNGSLFQRSSSRPYRTQSNPLSKGALDRAIDEPS